MATPIRNRLLIATEQSLRETGASGLKARVIAQSAGCAVGSIYKSFSNLEAAADLVIADVFRRLAATLSQTVREQTEPHERAVSLAEAYLQFAREEGNLWLAIFEIPAQAETPEGRERQKSLELVFAEATPTVAALVGPTNVDAVTQMIWASLHGLSHLEATGTLAGGDPSVSDALARRVVEAILDKESPQKETDDNR